MKIKRSCILIILSFVLLYLVAGCGRDRTVDTPARAPETPFLEGTNGLKVEFLDGSPPEEVTDGGTFGFQAIVSLKNEGEFALTKDQVKVDIIGILPEDFSVSMDDLNDKLPEDDPTPTVRDAEGNVVEGVETFVTFPSIDGVFNFAGTISGNTIFLFRADVCYKYQTKGLTQLCVLKDLINIDDNAVCDPTKSERVFSSSSPVVIKNFKQSVAGKDKVQFRFDIVHLGSGAGQFGRGEVFKEGDAASPPADCPRDPKERREKEDRVKVTVDTGLPNLKCVGFDAVTTGSVRLVNGRRTITCNQELNPDRTDFETPVNILLDFNYRDIADQEVLVKHLVD